MEPEGLLSCSQDPTTSTYLSQMNPVHTFSPYFHKVYSNIIFPSMPRSSEWCFPFRFSNQTLVCISHPSNAFCVPRPSHPP